MGNRSYKNYLKLREERDPITNRENLTKEPLSYGTPFPKTLEYKDIDIAFKEWVEEKLDISFEDKQLQTICLFSNQRFSEFMQAWEYTDESRNMLLNFKVITRENNPKEGTIQGGDKNIPADITFLLKRVLVKDKNGRTYIKDYRIRQPLNVDLSYQVSVVTNKFELLNEFNEMVNDRFKAFQDYIFPNGYALPMELKDISDKSEYNINDRQFFSQSYNILVMAYVLREEDFIEEERPIMKTICLDDNVSRGRTSVEIEECDDKNLLSIYIRPSENKMFFKIDRDFVLHLSDSENVRNFKLKVNEVEIHDIEGYELRKDDEVKIFSIRKYENNADSKLIFTSDVKDVNF